MGLSSALDAATSGLRVAQAGLDVVAQNVANAGSPGYTRRVLNQTQLVAGDRTAGVRTGEIERVLDLAAQRQLLLEKAGAAYTSYRSGVLSQVDQLFGQPGGAGSLDRGFNDFTAALQALATDPASASARSGVLAAGSALSSGIASAAEGIQALRTDAETRLASDVARANDLLAGIARLDGQVAEGGGTNAALLDQRDSFIEELSTLVDVQTSTGGDGRLTLKTGSGFTLLQHGAAVKLSFDSRGELGPASLYSTDPSARGVGTITATGRSGVPVDLVAAKAFRSGEIAAALDLRDTALPQAQRQLDELAAGLSRALSDREVAGTASSSGGASGFDIDLAGLQAGNAVLVDFSTGSGPPQRVVLVASRGGVGPVDPAATSYPGATVRTIDISGAPATLAAQISAALGSGFGVASVPGSPTTVRILDDGSAGAPDILRVGASITSTGLAEGRPQLPFFVDAGLGGTAFTGSFDGGSRLTGLAQRLVVNPGLLADPSGLVTYATNPATPQGDPTRPRLLYEGLTSAVRTFAGAGLDGTTGSTASTVADYARSVVATQGSRAENAKRLDEGQQVALSTAQSRFGQDAAVNIDSEMAKLIELQTAYGANARLMTAIRDMLDTLMRV